MATVSGLKVCPNCKGELPEVVPEWCPHCNTDTAFRNERKRKAVERTQNHRWAPKSVFEQFSAEYNALVEKPKDDKEEKELNSKLSFLIKERREYYAGLSYDAKIACLYDAHQIIREVLHSHMDGEELKNAINVGKKIGDIAKAAEEFVKTCGAPL